MEKYKISMNLKKIISLPALFFPLSLFALPGDDNIAQSTGFYAKLQAGWMIPEKELDSELGDHHVNDISVWGKYIRGKYILGYQWDRTVAMQFGYFRAVDREGNGESVDSAFRSTLSYWDFAAIGLLPISQRITITGLLGLALAQQVVTGSTSHVTPNQNYTHLTPEVGMGARYNFTPQFSVGLEPFFVLASGSIHSAFFIPFGIEYIF